MLVTKCDCSDLLESERLAVQLPLAQSSGKKFVGKRVANQSLMNISLVTFNALGRISARGERRQGQSLPTGSDRINYRGSA